MKLAFVGQIDKFLLFRYFLFADLEFPAYLFGIESTALREKLIR